VNNYFNQPGARVVTPAYSPQIINGLSNGVQYAFVMNATKNGGPAGSASPSIAVTPRLAGASWMTTTGTVGSLPTNINFKAITFGGGLFVAVGEQTAAGQNAPIYTGAYNGTGAITWTAQNSNFDGSLYGVVWTGSFLVAVGTNGTILYSVDGITWNTSKAATAVTLRGVTAGAGFYIAVGDGGTIITSTDLINWNVATVGTADFAGVNNLAGDLVAVGANGSLYVSVDTVNWQRPAGLPAGLPTLRGAAYGSLAPTPIFVAVGDNGTILSTTDLVNFTPRTLPGGLTPNLRWLTYGSRFVAVGDSGAIFFSDDGITWTQSTATPAVQHNLNGVVFGLGAYVAAGDAGENALAR